MTDFLELAIKEVGSQKKLAALIGVSQPAISYWANGRSIGPKYATKIEKATGGKVRREDLCPEVFL